MKLNRNAPSRRGFTFLELMTVILCIGIICAIAVPNFLEAQVRSKVTRSKVELLSISAALEAYYSDYLAYPPNIEPFPAAPGWTEPPVSRLKAKLRPFPAAPSQSDKPVSQRNPYGYRDMPGMQGAPEPFMTNSYNAFVYSGFSNPTPVDQETSHLLRPHLEPYGSVEDLARIFSHPNMSPPSGVDLSTRMALNAPALAALLAPTPYLGAMPYDPFQNKKNYPYTYFNYSPYDTREDWLLPAGFSPPHYLLMSNGPDTGPTLANPYDGVFISYNPTNGTVSSGDILFFDGAEQRF